MSFRPQPVVFNSIEDVREHKWVGNAYSDSTAFDAIAAFVQRDDVSVDDKYEAIDLMGTDGMGLDPLDIQYADLSKQDVIDEFLKDCE